MLSITNNGPTKSIVYPQQSNGDVGMFGNLNKTLTKKDPAPSKVQPLKSTKNGLVNKISMEATVAPRIVSQHSHRSSMSIPSKK